MAKNKIPITLWIIVIICFLVTFYWVEFSPWGNSGIAKYNMGYGTFDMKSYNTDIVTNILSTMEEEGFRIYKLYLLGDFLFAIAFCLLQTLLLLLVWNFISDKKIYPWFSLIPILRSLADIVENMLLLITLNNWPTYNDGIITISSYFTKMKLFMIGVWSLIFLIGIIAKIIHRFIKSSN